MNNPLKQNITTISVLKYTLPSIIMMVVMSLYTVVDGTFVSQLIGTDAFSAVNIIYPLLSFTIGLGTMFGSGITALVSTQLGQGKLKEANQNFTFIILFSILLGAILSIITFLFLDQIIVFLGANEVIFKYCFDYAYPLAFFFFANILQFQFQNLYIADGKPYLGLILTMLGGLTNIILDYLFIATFHMGISGAALATGIGYLIPAIFGLFYFTFNSNHGIHFVKPRFNATVLKNTITNGSSEMVNYLSTSITTFLFNTIMMRLAGQNGVAAIAILLYIDFILVAISMGYAIGVAPLFSYHHGANAPHKIQKLYKISIRFNLIVGIIMCSLTLLFSKPLALMFATPNSEVFTLAVSGLTIYAFSYLFKGTNIFASALFTAFENGKISAVLSFMRTLFFIVFFLITFSYLFGITGVWVATPVAEALALSIAGFCLHRFKHVYHYAN